METNSPEGLALLRVPFPPHQISTLPKGGVKLSYVGHAALTDRLLDADPLWHWEPVAMDERGLPCLDGFGGMWIKLTVCGVTRLGYGHAGTKEGGDAIKEIIGDALRNAAMRFGAALDLWHKGELHKDDTDSLVPVLEASIEQEKQKRAGVMAAVLPSVEAYLDAKTKTALAKLAFEVGEAFKHPKEGAGLAYDRIEIEELNSDEKLYLWSMLDSKIRSALKRERETRSLSKETA
jgi:hypothetical protein